MIVEILFIVFWVLGLILLWPHPAIQAHPWSFHGYYMIMFALVGLALFSKFAWR